MAALGTLPDEVVRKICTHLCADDLLRLHEACASERLREVLGAIFVLLRRRNSSVPLRITKEGLVDWKAAFDESRRQFKQLEREFEFRDGMWRLKTKPISCPTAPIEVVGNIR